MRIFLFITVVPLLLYSAVALQGQDTPRPEVLIRKTINELESRKELHRILDLDASFPAYRSAILRVGRDRGMIVTGREELLDCSGTVRWPGDCALPFEAGTLLLGFGEIERLSAERIKLPFVTLFPFGNNSVRQSEYVVIFEKSQGNGWNVVEILPTRIG